MTTPEEFKIPLTNTLIQAIGDYLISRPYKEVAGLIAGLQQEVSSNTKPNGPETPESVKVTGELQ